MTVNTAQHKMVNLLKTLLYFSVIMCCSVFNVWPKTTLLPVRHRDSKRLDILSVVQSRDDCGLNSVIHVEVVRSSWIIDMF